ncbi:MULTISPECIES: aspartyl-phosphate phosphatase Spo0E family protein [Gracilibacillus]|uniref:Spo0E family sporulation regulatory protein-aspartic acid phosphatase n=1 Tax=Gracilibacillus dipsosauri TaxID=178340 RepID=A0A317KUP1_9BACI|nr:aspartyl-phosphate phosphatase Spo0E family protein [Gracilibacillus dipsosauri]PWU67187.1 Spo0E family sporulation regulatory protein-aspartic acid phosphatase [Gracilibacillus dipsosauri]
MSKESNVDDIGVLLEKIEIMRRELLDIGFRDGLTAPSTLEYSELLDEEIRIYQKIIKDI